MSRRRYPWYQIAATAMRTPGVWRQHRALIAVTPHLLRHAQRRVPAFHRTDGTFEFRVGADARDDMGRRVHDVQIRYTRRDDGQPESTQGSTPRR